MSATGSKGKQEAVSRGTESGALSMIAALLGMESCISSSTIPKKGPPPRPSRTRGPTTPSRLAGPSSTPPSPCKMPTRPAEAVLYGPSYDGAEFCGTPSSQSPEKKAYAHIHDLSRAASEASTMPASSPHKLRDWSSYESASTPSTPGAPSGPSTPHSQAKYSSSPVRSSGSGRSFSTSELKIGGAIPLELHLELTLVVRAWNSIAREARKHCGTTANETSKVSTSRLAIAWSALRGTASRLRLERSEAAEAAAQAHCIALASRAFAVLSSMSLSRTHVKLTSLEKWLEGRNRTAAKRQAFAALRGGRAKKVGFLEMSVARAEAERSVELAERMKGLLARQVSLARSQEDKIGELRAKLAASETHQREQDERICGLVLAGRRAEGEVRMLREKVEEAEARRASGEAEVSSFFKGFSAAAQQHRACVAPSPPAVDGCDAEARLERSMKLLSDGLRRSGARAMPKV